MIEINSDIPYQLFEDDKMFYNNFEYFVLMHKLKDIDMTIQYEQTRLIAKSDTYYCYITLIYKPSAVFQVIVCKNDNIMIENGLMKLEDVPLYLEKIQKS